MTIAAFKNFMDAQARDLDRTRWSRGLSPAELDALSEEELADYVAWQHEVRAQENRSLSGRLTALAQLFERYRRPKVTAEDRYLQGDYDHVDSRQRHELGE